MNSASSLMASFGTTFNSLSVEMILIIILSLFIIILLLLIWNIHLRLKRLLRGKGTSSIEESILKISSELQDLIEFRRGSEEYLTTVEKRLRTSVQAIETFRFNAFKGSGGGGNQSFATAFINENGEGLVISTLYSSGHMSIFAKPISKFTSQFELTEEEKMVLDKASHRLTK